MCFSGYITASSDTPSKSGLCFTDLAGCTVKLLDDLTKEDHADWTACFNYLYSTAQRNLEIDLQAKLANRFHIDQKLLTRETSEYLTTYNSGSSLAGVKIRYYLPKYARNQVLSIGVYAAQAGSANFYIYKDDENGLLLDTITETLTQGYNTIEYYEDFEYNTLFIAYNPAQVSLKTTKNKFYVNDLLSEKMCGANCFGMGGYVLQVNGGGLNVKFVIYCSLEKFICENLPLFRYSLFYRLGVDTMKERLTTQKVNKTSVLTAERAKELMTVFNEDYQAALNSATMNIKMQEDPYCFMCKNTVSSKTNLP